MARTKQTARKVVTKRKGPTLFSNENPSKKRKVANSNVNNKYDSDTSSESSLSSSSSMLMQRKNVITSENLNTLLADVQNTFDGKEHNELEMVDFAHELLSQSNAYIKKTNEISNRKHVVADFLKSYKENMLKSSDYYNTSNYNMLGDTLLMIRNNISNHRQEFGPHGGCCFYYWDYRADVALKTVRPHKKYVKKMHKLLKNYVGGISAICSIICDYSHTGYIWYGFRLTVPENDEDDWKSYNLDGIMFNLAFNYDDYFKNIDYYHNKESQIIRSITLDSVKDDLGIAELTDMSDEQMLFLIMSMCMILFDVENELEDEDEWMEKQHN
eukprot:162309_1